MSLLYNKKENTKKKYTQDLNKCLNSCHGIQNLIIVLLQLKVKALWNNSYQTGFQLFLPGISVSVQDYFSIDVQATFHVCPVHVHLAGVLPVRLFVKNEVKRC